MPINILMPALSPTMTEGNLAKWLKKEGDKVKAGDVLAEIETDKATMEVEAVDEGTLAKILVPGGAQGVKVNDIIAVLTEEGEDASAVGAAPAAKAAPAPAPAPIPVPKLQAPVLTAPQPIPQAAKSPSSAPVTNRADVLRDVMKDVELPLNAPKYGDIAPMKPAEVKKSAQPKLGAPERSDLDAMLKKLNVPDMAAPQVAVPQEPPKPNVTPAKRASLSEEMTSDLDRELQDLKKLQAPPPVKTAEPVREVKPMFREPQPPATAPPVTASVARTKPTPMLRVPGMSGSNPYLARVQARISGFWTAPPVDLSGKVLTVTVRFRLERDGRVGSVIIEQSSGNDYYDMAAQRAVQSAIPLPPFPPDLTDSYFDAHFTFAVGEAAG